MYFGLGVQTNGLKNGYTLGNTQVSDRASGLNYSFAWEHYDENSWIKIDCSLLLSAVASAVGNYEGLSVTNYNRVCSDRASSNKVNLKLNDFQYFKLIFQHEGAGFLIDFFKKPCT